MLHGYQDAQARAHAKLKEHKGIFSLKKKL